MALKFSNLGRSDDDAVLSRPPVTGSGESAVLAAFTPFTPFTYPCRRQAPLRRSARPTPEEHHA